MPDVKFTASTGIPTVAEVYTRAPGHIQQALQELSRLVGLPEQELCSEQAHQDTAVPFGIGAVLHRQERSKQARPASHTASVIPSLPMHIA